ncbi:hypothetical protein EVAR_67724_1 [Eumeta japonica]|uniref:Uncharacterized protein n=1 Tax=Eumeta variegata TaxID=151549 RepID=A0A4C1ZE00_EUMVA|nr:hypothetical protein EVAR_67724_1 [Eumeta japonica]
MILIEDLYYPGLVLRRKNTEEWIFAALKIYLTLVLMLLTLLLTKRLYDSLVVVKSKHKLLKESIFAWLTPLPVALLLLVLYCRVAWSVLTQYDSHSTLRNESRIRTITVFVIMFIVLKAQDVLINVNLILLVRTERITNTHKFNIVLKANYVLVGVSRYQCFASIVYWLCGSKKGTHMWKSCARRKFERFCCKIFKSDSTNDTTGRHFEIC